MITSEVPQWLGLAPERWELMAGVFGDPVECPVYPMTVILAMEDDAGYVAEAEFDADVVAMPSRDDHVQGILGRDFLATFRFVYDGPNARGDLIPPDALMAGVRRTRTLADHVAARKRRKSTRGGKKS